MSRERPISDAELDALDESLSPGPVSADLRVAQLEAALGQQEVRLAGMLRIAGNLGQSRDPKKAMRAMVVDISQLLQADRTTIYEVRKEEGMLRGLAVEGEISLEVGVPIGSGIAGLVAERGRIINLKDAYLHPSFDPKFDKLTGYRTRSMLVVPMRNSRREIIGVVQVLNKCDGYFTVDDQQLLTALAAQAAITLEALRLQLELNLSNTELSDLSRQLRQKVRELELLYQNEQAIGDAGDEAELAERILKLACRVGRSEVAVLYLPDSEAGAGPAWVRGGGAGGSSCIRRVEIGDGVLGKVASRGEVLVLAGDAFEAQAIPRTLGGGHPLVVDDAVAVPLLDGDVTMGAFALVNRRDPARRNDADDRQLAVLVAGQVARAVARLRSREDAQRRDRMMTIGQMMSGVLHDLRGPMSVISGYSQLMAGEDDPAQRAEMSAAIRRKIELFNDMTREVMAFARGERHVLCRKVFLDKFVRAVRESVEEEFRERGVAFEWEENTAKGISFFDESKLLRVVTNIARNARQAMGHSGTFRWIIEDTPDGGTRMRMRDTGPGIPESIRARLFEAFTTEGKKEGTGLGLAIVRRIVEDHGGTITFTTETGQGTEFVITLPPPPPEQAT
ncbi:MAG: GAF domain-containing protein [Myxococcales bacterium]|nr:GAF domain-containing protein [Myxococcales bacterium]